MRIPLLISAVLLSGCAGGAPQPDWQLNAKAALDSFQQRYLRGDTRAAAAEFERAKAELGSTGNPALVARAELVRCAARAASLEFDNCPGFEKLRADAGAEELVYADFLSGKNERTGTDDPLSGWSRMGSGSTAGKRPLKTFLPPSTLLPRRAGAGRCWRGWACRKSAPRPRATARRWSASGAASRWYQGKARPRLCISVQCHSGAAIRRTTGPRQRFPPGGSRQA